MNNKAPIGVFDSGVGGLTVLEVLQKMFPYEDFIYLADSAYCPYGTKTPNEVSSRVSVIGEEMIRRGVKAIVIACNTATANASSFIKTSSVPVIGVIAPTAQMAYKLSKNKKIALLATDLTVKMGVYEKELPKVTLYSLASSLFVPLAESNKPNSKATQQIVNSHLEPLKEKDFDTIIYGCTHFGLLDKAIKKALPNRVVVESGKPTGEELAKVLACQNITNDLSVLGSTNLYTTGLVDEFIKQITWFKGSFNGPFKW